MKDGYWAKMPCSWQTDCDFHDKIKQAPTGEAIAALKLYLGLCLKSNYKKRESLPDTGCARQTLTRLCELVGLSRPMVVKGLRLLMKWDVIELMGIRPAVYHIKEYETATYWTRLPKSFLFQSKEKEFKAYAIIAMGSRGKSVLHALQLYLYLASIRDKSTERALVTYTQITHILGISRQEVSTAISVLTSHDLVTVRQSEEGTASKRVPCNSYWLRGSDKAPVIDMQKEQRRHNDAVKDFGSMPVTDVTL